MKSLRAVLPTPVKKCVWDAKYSILGYPRFVAPVDVVDYLSKRLPEGSSVLDLGCGRGSLLDALRALGWMGSYCGVDISGRAIQDARKGADQRSSWAVSDFESFQTPFKWDIIAMVESLCYVKPDEVPSFLAKMIGALKPGGGLLIRLHDLVIHRTYVDQMYHQYPHTKQVGANLFIIIAAIQPV